MPNNLVIGLGLGLVSAVVFVSATTGPAFIRYLLFLLTPLALGLAALGWGRQAGLVAGLTASLLVALLLGQPAVGLVFAATQAAPILFLAHRAGLHRDIVTSAGPTGQVEWYPVGHLVLWAAAISSLIAILVLLSLGEGSVATIEEKLKEAIQGAVTANMPNIKTETPLTAEEIDALTDVAVAFTPAGIAISMMAGLLLNLYIAGRVSLSSGHAQRPWPDIAALTYPIGTAIVLVAAMLASQAGGFAGFAATAVTGTLFFAYLLLGLAVIHFVTRRQGWRLFALWLTYFSLVFLNTIAILLLILLGLFDTALGLRRKSKPPDAQG